MIALSALPWRAIGLGLAAALMAAAGWVANGWRLGEQLANLQATYATEQRNQALVQINAVDRARLEEQRRTTAQTKATNDAIKQSEQDRADRVAADAAARELRARVTALVNASRTPGDSAAAGGGQTAGQAADLLVDVLGGIDGAAGELAAYADAARTAGEACERAYDALMPTQADSGGQ